MKRRSTPQLIGAAALCFALALLIAVIPTVIFVKTITKETLQPIAEFPSNQSYEFIDETPYSSYHLSMQVLDLEDDLPEMTILITDEDGAEIIGDPVSRWSSVMGKQYKQFLELDQNTQGPLNFNIETSQPQNLLIFRKAEDGFQLALSKALPLWILALVPLLVMVLFLAVVLVRAINASSSVNMKLSE